MEIPEKGHRHHFDIHASVVLQLGDALITDVSQALVELVKNSYDADANYVKVIIDTEGKPGGQSYYPDAIGYISIEDDGIGMDDATITRGWLTVSKSPKREMKKLGKTTERGRTPLGDKGLGRLCTQRLANNLEIFTRPKGSLVEYHVAFSWKSFSEEDVSLTEVPVLFEEMPAQMAYGTKILIVGLKDREAWSDRRTVEDLQVGFSQLISPYAEARDFIVSTIFNGRRLELAEYSSQLKKASVLNYKFDFNEEELLVKGKAKLDFFKPSFYAPKEEKQDYRSFVKEDGGKNLFNFLASLNQADRYRLRKADEEDWYIEYEYKRKFINIEKVKLLDRKPASPGPFHGELDSFRFDFDREEASPSLGGDEILRNFIKDCGGLRVYRDGFGIRIDSDLLELRKQQTSGRSYYGLRPDNIAGYVAISAKQNAVLEEVTSREGFQATLYYENFYLILQEISKFTIDVQSFVRRGYIEFKRKEREKEYLKVLEEKTPEKIAVEINEKLSSAVVHRESLKKTRDDLEGAAKDAGQIVKFTEEIPSVNVAESQTIQVATQNITKKIEQAKKEISQVEVYLGNTPELQRNFEFLTSQINLLKSQIALLGEQLSQTYETVSLGLTAEALSHEIKTIADQLAYRNRQIIDYLASRNNNDVNLISFTRYISTTVASLRKQLSHLEPSLRYVRENREKVILSEYFAEVESYYKSRFAAQNMEIQIKDGANGQFTLSMNKGKFNQIIDNLLLNSEYWLNEEWRLKRIVRGIITIELSKPYVRVSDNGRGIDPTVEKSLFEPFVTTKGQGRGRGLGLFIVQQLLASENCTISLTDARNKYGRMYVFEIDFTGGLDVGNK
jgi:signal transduction histidine kinase